MPLWERVVAVEGGGARDASAVWLSRRNLLLGRGGRERIWRLAEIGVGAGDATLDLGYQRSFGRSRNRRHLERIGPWVGR